MLYELITFRSAVRSEKFESGARFLNGDSNPELCDADAAMFNQMSYQTKWELVVYMCVDDKPVGDGF